MSAPVRSSSSVTSARRRHVVAPESRDAWMMTSLRWSRRWYSVGELAQEFRRRFPLIVRVMHGCRCSGVNNDVKLDVGQV